MLVKTITEIKTFVTIGVGNDVNRILPHISNAENAYIKPLLGTNMYDELQEFYDAVTPVNPTVVQQAMIGLLAKVQLSLVNLAYYVGFDTLSVLINDQGFSRVESDRSKSLFKYQEENLKATFKNNGFNGLDDVLVFIETNITHFAEFKAQTNWTVLRQSFLPTVKVVQEIPFNLNASRLAFLNLKPSVSYIEDTLIKPLLGSTIYSYIKTEMVKDAPATKVTAILPYIRKPLVYLASALFMEETGAELGDKGLFFQAFEPNNSNITRKQPSDQDRILAMAARNRMIGNDYLEALKAYLLANVDDWEDYSGDSGFFINRDNNDKKIFVS
ncbi:MAG: hypothetical protein HQ541_05855 [Mariniphaga sp.]|nr:hypothetical protein [Mariniphaga sp.]